MATKTQVTAFFKEMGKLCVAESNYRISNDEPFVRPSVAMAQAALETGYGTSKMMVKANAYFGIKAGSSWTGKVYNSATTEVYDSIAVATTAVFRAYDSKAESVADYYSLILNSSRYAEARSYYPSQILSPYATIYAIWDGGYATDPNYVGKIMDIIDSYDLTEWDALIDGVSSEVDGIDREYEGTSGGHPVDTMIGISLPEVKLVVEGSKEYQSSALNLILNEIKKTT